MACLFAVSDLQCVFMSCNPQWRAVELRWFSERLAFRGVLTEPQFRQEWDRAADLLPPGCILAINDAPGGLLKVVIKKSNSQ